MNRYAKALETIGMVIAGTTQMMGREFQIATIKVGSAELRIYFDEQGTARFDKPNRTTKWFYEKSSAQLLNIAKQTLSFYTFR